MCDHGSTMDDHLRPASVELATLRAQLAAERARREELEQEVARFAAAIARQNAIIEELHRQQRELREDYQRLVTLVKGLQEQNALLRQQAALLQQENARLRGMPLASPPPPAPEVKPAAPKREQKVRKKRAPEQNAGRRKLERPNHWVTHAPEQCPRCGERLTDGWIHRRTQVIDLPPVAPLLITEHRIIRRQCPRCGTKVLPPPPGAEAQRVGRCRFGPRLIATIASMHTVERLPGAVIQERLQREYGLQISAGGLRGLLRRMAEAGTPAYEQLQQDIRGSPAVNADETGWRENGQHTTVWTVCTPHTVYVHHGRRTNEAIDGILGPDFGGTIGCDCYAAYDHFPGPKQRCWAHLLRDLDALLHEQSQDADTVAWVAGIGAIFEQARQPRPAEEDGWGYHAVRARQERARRCEALILQHCPADLDPRRPYATLAARLRRHVGELFTFVRDPGVEATNNAAERSLRPLVIARKISGGTRTARGSTIRMTLYSLAATARMQGKNPTQVFQQLLLAPPGAPSPLVAPRTAR